MEIEFQRYITRNNIIPKGSKLLLAVSGGVDSMVMLTLFQRWSAYHIAVAHANFQLRGREADLDEQMVRTYCEKHGIMFHTSRFETAHHARKHHLSLQMAARELRYQWFEALIEEFGYQLVCTAHHADDDIENLLLTLTRTGYARLIPENNDYIVRPLLTFHRQQILAFAEQHHISWREDSSNEEDYYQRNYIRHHVIPRLREINPSLDKAAYRWKMEREWLNHKIQEELHAISTTEENKTVINPSGIIKLKNEPFLAHALLSGLGFNATQVDDVLKASPGSKVYSQSYQVHIYADQWVIVPVGLGNTFEIEINRSVLEAGALDFPGGHLIVGQTTERQFPSDPWKALMDDSAVKWPLILRTAKPGDTMQPLGMKGTKKISDILIDSKIRQPDKYKHVVLEDADGECIWLSGLRLSDKVKIAAGTSRIITFEVSYKH